MKTFKALVIATLSLVLGAHAATAQSMYWMGRGGGSEGAEVRQALVLKPEGNCLLTFDSLTSRKVMEASVRSWERYRSRSEDMDSEAGGVPDDDLPAVQPAKPEQKPLTDEELGAKIRQMYQQRSENDEESAYKVDKVEILTNLVRVVLSRSFGSLETLLAEGVYSWGPSMVPITNARFEIDTNHQFRITFFPAEQTGRDLKTLAREMKSEKVKYEWRLLAPGKILRSDFPQIDGNATGLTLDTEKPDSIDAVLKLVGTNLVIVSEAGGLKLGEPLDAMKVMRNSRRNTAKSGPDLPITEASPGFIAQATGLTISTLYLFPEGEKRKKDSSSDYNLSPYLSGGPPGVRIMAKLFPPQGRELRDVSPVQVRSAKDNQGRAVGAPASEDEPINLEDYGTSFSAASSAERGGPATIQIGLALPAPDAQTIEEVNAEAIALTIGSWKELTLTNVQADTNLVIALDEVLPGAKLIIRKISTSSSSTSVQARLEGPPAVKQLEVKFLVDTRGGGSSSNASDRRTTTSGDKTIREIVVQKYDYESSGRGQKKPVNLIVRSPQDVKRERVKFKLTGLDLL